MDKGVRRTMNNETKQVISALLAGRNYIYSLLHTLLGAEPTAERVAAATGEAAFQAIAMFDGEDSQAAKLLSAALELMRKTPVEDLLREYTKLFLGPEDYIAAPWESVYTSKERALFQESTLDVRAWFKRFGYVAGGYPNYPDDHISIMMQFMALMGGKANDALIVGEMEVCRNLIAGQMQFAKEHLLSWVFQYARDMQQSETNYFYPQLAIALAEFVSYDQQVLSELLEACEGCGDCASCGGCKS